MCITNGRSQNLGVDEGAMKVTIVAVGSPTCGELGS